MPKDRTLRARIARVGGAFVLYDLITGLAAYCVTTLAGLWLFSVTWIHIANEYAAVGRTFSTPGQLELAWLGTFLTLPVAGSVIYLAIRAYGLPRDISHTGGRESIRQVEAWFHGVHGGGTGPSRL